MTLSQSSNAPYQSVHVSSALTSTQLNALGIRGVDYSDAAVSGTTLTLGSQTLTVVDMTDDFKGLSPAFSSNRLPRESVGDSVANSRPGRQVFAMTSTMYVNYTEGHSYDAFYKNARDIRAIIAERDEAGEGFVGLWYVQSRTEQAVDDNGDVVFDVVFEYASKTPVYFL